MLMSLQKLLPFHENTSFVVSACLHRKSKLELVLDFLVEGPVEQLLYEVGPAVQQGDLWKQTCFEFFLSDTSTKYVEFNGSPSGAWALYFFDDYRQKSADQSVFLLKPELLTRVYSASQLKARWVVNMSGFERHIDLMHIGYGLTAVLKTASDTLYYAMEHVGENPDFHNRKSWLGQLSPVSL